MHDCASTQKMDQENRKRSSEEKLNDENILLRVSHGVFSNVQQLPVDYSLLSSQELARIFRRLVRRSE